jgi:hypothetical protein
MICRSASASFKRNKWQRNEMLQKVAATPVHLWMTPTWQELFSFVPPRCMIAQAMRASLTLRVKRRHVMNSSRISKINPLLSS